MEFDPNDPFMLEPRKVKAKVYRYHRKPNKDGLYTVYQCIIC